MSYQLNPQQAQGSQGAGSPLHDVPIRALFQMAPTLIQAMMQHFSPQNPAQQPTTTPTQTAADIGSQAAGAGKETQAKATREKSVPNVSASGGTSSGSGAANAAGSAAQLGTSLASGNPVGAVQAAGSLASQVLGGGSQAQPGQVTTSPNTTLGSGSSQPSTSGQTQQVGPTALQGQQAAASTTPVGQGQTTPQNNTDPLGESHKGPPPGKEQFNPTAAPQTSLNDTMHNLLTALSQSNPGEYQLLTHLFQGVQQNSPSTSSGIGAIT